MDDFIQNYQELQRRVDDIEKWLVKTGHPVVIVATDGSGHFNCDGDHDDIEIQAAINSLSGKGGTVYIKAGTYNIADPIEITNANLSGTTIKGSGMGKTIIKAQTAGYSGGEMLLIYSVNNINLYNFTLDGDKANQSVRNWGIYMESDGYVISAVEAKNMKRVSFGGDGFGLYSTGLLYNCRSHDNEGHGYYIYCPSTKSTIVSSTATSNGGGGFSLEVGGAIYGCKSSGNQDGVHLYDRDNACIATSIISNTRYGVHSFGPGVVAHCEIESNSTYQVYLQGEHVRILGNIIKTTTVPAVVVNSSYNVISQNRIFSQSSTGNSGINLTSSNYNRITDNILQQMARNGITLTASSYNSIIGNKIINTSVETNNTYTSILLTNSGGNNSQYNSISNNHINNTAANKPIYGIRETDTSQGPNVITSNVVLNTVGAKISNQHGSTIAASNLT